MLKSMLEGGRCDAGDMPTPGSRCHGPHSLPQLSRAALPPPSATKGTLHTSLLTQREKLSLYFISQHWRFKSNWSFQQSNTENRKNGS